MGNPIEDYLEFQRLMNNATSEEGGFNSLSGDANKMLEYLNEGLSAPDVLSPEDIQGLVDARTAATASANAAGAVVVDSGVEAAAEADAVAEARVAAKKLQIFESYGLSLTDTDADLEKINSTFPNLSKA